jgi:hypothetical protein
MILTRYLYEKEHVKYSLIASIKIGAREEAKFWAMELYFSGFHSETIELVGTIIELLDTKYLRIIEFLREQMTELRASQFKYWILGTIIENVGIRQTQNEIPKHIAISMRECDMKQYKTKLVIEGKSWKIPRRVCVFPLRQNPDLKPVSMDIYNNWLYFASFSPIWRARIDKHHGTVKHDTCEIVFDEENLHSKPSLTIAGGAPTCYDNDFDNFHIWHDYEPDEQPLFVKHNWIGSREPTTQCFDM